jgi:hypothetical protein
MSPELIEHFRNPRNVGELAAPAVTIEVSNPICGDILRLSVAIEEFCPLWTKRGPDDERSERGNRLTLPSECPRTKPSLEGPPVLATTD